MSFDPKEKRRQLKGFEIAHYRECAMADVKERAALNGTGRGMASCAVLCMLVGFFDVGRELLLKARTFIRGSIEYGEEPYLSEYHRLLDFALCNWLVAGSHDLKSLKRAVPLRERWFDGEPNVRKSEIQAALPNYLDAEEYETLMRRYERAGLAKPANLRRIQGEGTMSYAIAQHRLGLSHTDEEIEAAIHTFLKRRVPQWLDHNGAYADAARWMKLAFWQKGDDPVATVLRCYDYLPDLKPPKYP